MLVRDRQGRLFQSFSADGGELLTLPPDLRPFQPAPAGSYRLRSTGEVVLDPDYLATWTIRRPAVEDVVDPLP